MKSSKRLARIRAIKSQVASDANNYLPTCVIPNCGRATERATKTGIAAFHCRYHIQRRARNGSHWHRTYRAMELRPYASAAALWIQQHATDIFVSGALMGLKGLLQSSGRVTIASSLRGISPEKRALVAIARLRESSVSPTRLLTIYLAVSALIEDDRGSHRIKEFRQVQVAKAVHRLASGHHQKWEHQRPDGSVSIIEHHAYPKSSGRILRHLGNKIERECELVSGKFLPDIITLKNSLYGLHPSRLPHAGLSAKTAPV